MAAAPQQTGSNAMSLFVGDLGPEVTDGMLLEAFRSVYPTAFSGKVIKDIATGKCRGFGFVRFSSAAEAEDALTNMVGAVIGTRGIRVSRATSRTPDANIHHKPNMNSSDPNNTTVFVGNLDSSIDHQALRQLFEPYGVIVSIKIPVGRACGFVNFQQHSEAESAIRALHGHTLGPGPIRLSWGRARTPGQASQAYQRQQQQQQQQQFFYQQQQQQHQQQMMYYQQQQYQAAMAAQMAAAEAQKKEHARSLEAAKLKANISCDAGEVNTRTINERVHLQGQARTQYGGARIQVSRAFSHGLEFNPAAYNSKFLTVE